MECMCVCLCLAVGLLPINMIEKFHLNFHFTIFTVIPQVQKLSLESDEGSIKAFSHTNKCAKEQSKCFSSK